MSTIDASDHDSRDVVDRYRVVVVMASFYLAITLKRVLEMIGYAAEIATDGQAALELVISMQPDAVISAIELAGLDGFELASRIRDSVPRKPLMIANSSYCKTDIAQGNQVLSCPLRSYRSVLLIATDCEAVAAVAVVGALSVSHLDAERQRG